jgi:hypothetical protein
MARCGHEYAQSPATATQSRSFRQGVPFPRHTRSSQERACARSNGPIPMIVPVACRQAPTKGMRHGAMRSRICTIACNSDAIAILPARRPLPTAHTFFARARLRAIEWANPDDRSGRLQAGSYEWHASWRAVATKVCDRRGAAIRRGERFSAIHPFIATKGYIMVVRPPRGAATPCEPEPGSVRRPSPTAPVEASPPDSPNGANP